MRRLLRGRRRIYEVRYAAPGWVVQRRSGRRVGLPFATKDDAVDAGAKRCRRVMRCGGRAQLVVYKQDGTYDYERTYPDETPKRRG